MSPSLIVRITPLALSILAAVAHWFVPRLTRPDLYFAATVAPGFRDSPEGRFILHRYRQGLIGVSALALSVLAALILTRAFPLEALALLLQFSAYFGLFYRARRAVLPHRVLPTTVREAQLIEHGRRIPGGWAVASGPFALLAACAAYVGMHWGHIPARLIVHWGAQGQPVRWAPRSFDSVFFPLLNAGAILAALTLLLYGIAHWLRPIYATGPLATRESRFRRTMSIALLAVQYSIAALFSWITLRPLLPASYQRPPSAVALLPGLTAIAFVVILMWLGQGGSRTRSAHRQEPGSTKPAGDRTEDRFWKLGVFYFNRDDPAVIVEKRFGLGYTMNFAHPMAWAIIGLLLLIPIAVTTSIALRHLRR